MPTYEYECEKCKKTFDLFQSMKDETVKTCPRDKCRQKTWGKGKVHRLLGTGAGLIFKGSGFYITDYRSEGYKESAKKDTPASTETKSSDSKPSETKTTEAKPAAKTTSEKPKSGGKKE
jgi:putative FmdB family regulatory protein